MPLYKCTNAECGALENTALGDYWDKMYDDKVKEALCSECATGQWHGHFPKTTPEAAGLVIGTDDFYHSPAELRGVR